MSITLRGYQEEAHRAFLESSFRRKLVVMATGTGKTITALSLAKKIGGRMLWLTHTNELVDQVYAASKIVWPEKPMGIVKAERGQYHRHNVVASIQSARSPKRIEILKRQGFDLVIIDEAHHSLSTGYRSVVEALGCYTDDGPQLLGLTATPERSDNAALSDMFEGIVFQMGIESAIAAGCLVQPEIIARPIQINLDEIKTSKGDFMPAELDLALMRAGIVEEICNAYEEHAIGRKSLIFVVSVSQAHAVADALKARGHKIEAISGETKKEDRKTLLEGLANGSIRGLVNCQLLTEGFDEPSVDCVILGRPTKSKPLLIQKVGRGLRLFPGKTDCRVIDLVGVSKKNTLIQAAVLFGIEPEEEETKIVSPDPIMDPEQYWRGRLLSQIKGAGGAPRSSLRWIAGSHGSWMLSVHEFGTVRMIPHDNLWEVDVVGIRRANTPSSQKLSTGPVDTDIAQALAEDYVRRCDMVSKVESDAQWRTMPATMNQVTMLRKMGIKSPERLTRGIASDLITQKISEPATPKQIGYLRRLGYSPSATLTKREAGAMIGKHRSRA